MNEFGTEWPAPAGLIPSRPYRSFSRFDDSRVAPEMLLPRTGRTVRIRNFFELLRRFPTWTETIT
jgi:hypothetical protein